MTDPTIPMVTVQVAVRLRSRTRVLTVGFPAPALWLILAAVLWWLDWPIAAAAVAVPTVLLALVRYRQGWW